MIFNDTKENVYFSARDLEIHPSEEKKQMCHNNPQNVMLLHCTSVYNTNRSEKLDTRCDNHKVYEPTFWSEIRQGFKMVAQFNKNSQIEASHPC